MAVNTELLQATERDFYRRADAGAASTELAAVLHE